MALVDIAHLRIIGIINFEVEFNFNLNNNNKI